MVLTKKSLAFFQLSIYLLSSPTIKPVQAFFSLIAILSAFRNTATATSIPTIAPTTPPTQTPTYTLTDGLVAYYPLNGNANDMSGNGNNGVKKYTTSAYDRFGIPNGCLYFNGSSYIIINNAGQFNFENTLSVSAWIKPSSNQGSYAGLVSKGTLTGVGWVIEMATTDNLFNFGFRQAVPDQFLNPTPTIQLRANAWNFILVTKQDKTITWYCNATLASTTTVQYQEIKNGNTSLTFGAESSDGVTFIRPYKGSMDDIRIYNRAVTANEAYQLFANDLSPTLQPTVKPTVNPSPSPTARPTSQPSRQPSQQPTARPSQQPTAQPNGRPSRQPTSQPSRRPTGQPSGKPSGQPTTQPFAKPTNQPSGKPTGQPTRKPSGQPSQQPTAQPSQQPTTQPNGRPSRQPTSQPSRRPTGQPSGRPSDQPTTQPFAKPTNQPSGKPTGQPSGKPTGQPTRKPSGQPSQQPTAQPNGRPSRQPTSQPSQKPTGQPSGRPSDQPTTQPFVRPTNQPSGKPTSQPTRKPSGQPTSQPNQKPSGKPTNQPVANPTGKPSKQPTTQPTWRPTSRPTNQPSSKPSGQPSNQPSGKPTGQPSRKPSAQPTGQPNRQPSSQPSGQPNSRPSRKPTNQPTQQPSSQPTHQPTAQPKQQPTSQPTDRPRARPTSRPSQQPTNQPTTQPSRQPTEQPFKPTKLPTISPTDQPTINPTVTPTVVPTTEMPSVEPTKIPSPEPTEKPSQIPSEKPSEVPSQLPSIAPSYSPSLVSEAAHNWTTESAWKNATSSRFFALTVLNNQTFITGDSELIHYDQYGNSVGQHTIPGTVSSLTTDDDSLIFLAGVNNQGYSFITVFDTYQKQFTWTDTLPIPPLPGSISFNPAQNKISIINGSSIFFIEPFSKMLDIKQAFTISGLTNIRVLNAKFQTDKGIAIAGSAFTKNRISLFLLYSNLNNVITIGQTLVRYQSSSNQFINHLAFLKGSSYTFITGGTFSVANGPIYAFISASNSWFSSFPSLFHDILAISSGVLAVGVSTGYAPRLSQSSLILFYQSSSSNTFMGQRLVPPAGQNISITSIKEVYNGYRLAWTVQGEANESSIEKVMTLFVPQTLILTPPEGYELYNDLQFSTGLFLGTQIPSSAITVNQYNLSTSAPTVTPSNAPTTLKPSPKPTRNPTARPSVHPSTFTPSVKPTTFSPSNPGDTNQPTFIPPTVEPTTAPTEEPSPPPSIEPTPLPSIAPTLAPSPSPTAPPTLGPTPPPTPSPTENRWIPSVAPSSNTTLSPTIQNSSSPMPSQANNASSSAPSLDTTGTILDDDLSENSWEPGVVYGAISLFISGMCLYLIYWLRSEDGAGTLKYMTKFVDECLISLDLKPLNKVSVIQPESESESESESDLEADYVQEESKEGASENELPPFSFKNDNISKQPNSSVISSEKVNHKNFNQERGMNLKYILPGSFHLFNPLASKETDDSQVKNAKFSDVNIESLEANGERQDNTRK